MLSMKNIYKILIVSCITTSTLLLPQTTLLEVKVVCSNNGPLTQAQVDTYLKGGKLVGKPFNIGTHKNCSFIAIKAGTPSENELVNATDAIYASILGEEIF